MTITSVGYDGTVDELVWSTYAPLVGAPPCVVVGAAPTIVTGADRTVRIPDGTVLWGDGVLDTIEGNQDLQTTSVTSGSRWDTVIVRRDWTGNESTLEIIQGTGTKTIATLPNSTPGELCDYPVALIRAQSGMTALQEVVDLRYWAGRVRWRRYTPPATELDYGDMLLTEYPPGTDMLDLRLRIGGSGTEWLQGLVGARPNGMGLASGITAWASDTEPTVVRQAGRIWLAGAVKRTSGNFAAGQAYLIDNLGTAYGPRNRHIFATQASSTNGAQAARVIVYPTGRVELSVPYESSWVSLDGCSWHPKD